MQRLTKALTFYYSAVTTPEKYYILSSDEIYEVRDSNAPYVTGFSFPLVEPEEVERLENSVSQNDRIREEYVNFLTRKKPAGMSIVQFLPMVFSDEALDGYNYNGSNALGKCKLPMKGYDIFSHCFIDIEFTCDDSVT
ncbi:uncharacterized protein LOC129730231 isoform X1 [Wyeomyia smithii]|uniref:uncharacterized protein LOC129730009 n=1 Tax=Wyeomyia smithii TaxID=174621 RepID=UPI002467EBBC|nr:uncharacterized protein LOC129722644 isoform X2 [Wyeomyia smithii]XP_055534447.1 uncharacterized protein LOC129723960 isoform X1 [Wyeomyia smithii]XP_055537335.1 uncharacterized protein LOC129725473 isoform X1 [Wyeomyia smithii]XP_055537649.1 uncharacterized protein LOC129725628 isoform X1 [Wyeomyia smithii]XP_055544931.1 uncharacterized protein LOC129730009 [Wyeomyia smithii]XP_055545293.1 uncharacterized protein LOC129730186 isoform X1 [Wyeomyia smithii]XP_055545361.1 uncharacterized pro